MARIQNARYREKATMSHPESRRHGSDSGLPPEISKAVPPSDFLKSGMKTFPEIVQQYYDAINKKYGTSHKPAY